MVWTKWYWKKWYGQNGIGQNGMDKMVNGMVKMVYEQKMVLGRTVWTQW